MHPEGKKDSRWLALDELARARHAIAATRYAGYCVLSDSLREHLHAVTPSHPRPGIDLFPCRATLREGRVMERVVVLDADGHRSMGYPMFPEDDPPVATVALSDVVRFEESIHRLPADLATAVWEHGEYQHAYLSRSYYVATSRRLTSGTRACPFSARPGPA